MKILCKSPNDDIEEWYLGGELIIYSNHDEHGWSGMEAIRTVFEKYLKN